MFTNTHAFSFLPSFIYPSTNLGQAYVLVVRAHSTHHIHTKTEILPWQWGRLAWIPYSVNASKQTNLHHGPRQPILISIHGSDNQRLLYPLRLQQLANDN